MTWTGALLVLCVACSAAGQSASGDATSLPHPVIRKLSPFAYPPGALAARVSGKVDLKIVLKRDGTVESVNVASGPELLRPAAVQSAERSQFDCEGCTDASTTLHLLYNFELGSPIGCTGESDESYPQFQHTTNTVTIAAQPRLICDPAMDTSTVRTRSWRCGFLWKCGWRKLE